MKTTHLTPALKHNAGTQPLSPRWPALGSVLSHLALFLCLAALLVGAALVAHAAVSPHAGAANQATCHTTQVTLHGRASPTIGCLDGRQKGDARVLPSTGIGPLAHLAFQDYCYADALVLATGYNMGGNWLCINGSGILNLTDLAGNWNDTASSFWTGCYDDVFAVDINLGGTWATAYGSYAGEYSKRDNFPYEGVWDKSVSSIWQESPSYGGPHCAP